MPVNVFQRKDLYLPKRLVADILNHLIGHLIIAYIHQPLCQSCNERTNTNLYHNPEYTWEIHFTCSDDIVHCISGELRHIKCQRHRNRRK